MEVSQGANVHSPYSTKDPDGKAVMKRKGLVRSATFTAGSTDASDSSPLNTDMIGRLGYRGQMALARQSMPVLFIHHSFITHIFVP